MKQEKTTGEIIHSFFEAFRAIKSQGHFASPLFQMPLAQMETLRFIGEREPVSMKAVADFLAITPPSATVMVNNLVNLGYAKRSTGVEDRRVISLVLTKKGRQVLNRTVAERCRKMQKLLGRLNRKEQFLLLNLLRKMSNN